MMHKKKVKGVWKYYEGAREISEYEYIVFAFNHLGMQAVPIYCDPTLLTVETTNSRDFDLGSSQVHSVFRNTGL